MARASARGDRSCSHYDPRADRNSRWYDPELDPTSRWFRCDSTRDRAGFGAYGAPPMLPQPPDGQAPRRRKGRKAGKRGNVRTAPKPNAVEGANRAVVDKLDSSVGMGSLYFVLGSGASARRVKQLEEALRQKENREKVAAPPELPAVQPAW